MPSYIIPTVLLVGGAFVLFALCDWALWLARDWWAERAHREWQEANKPE